MGRPNYKRVIELEDLLQRLHAIDKEMPQEDVESGAGKSKGAKVDKFLELKSEFLKEMNETKNALRDAREQKPLTRTRDQIAANQNIRTKLKDLTRIFSEMESLYAKEARKKKSKIGPEELEFRGEFLTQFRRNLEELKRLSSKSFGMGTSVSNLAGSIDENDSENAIVAEGGLDTVNFFKSLPVPGASGTADGGGVELTDMQSQGLMQIKQRDQGFDDILDQIGLAVERAGEQAKAIADETELQNGMLNNLEENIDKTREKMISVNLIMKKSLEDSGAGLERFCTNCICCVILLGIIGLIVNVVL